MRCSYNTCPKDVIVRTYCEQHFLMQFVQPLQKERRNLEQALAIINSNIKEFVDELGLARAAARGIDKPERFLRERPQGGWTNSGTIFCEKCFKGFDSGIDCFQHQEDCKGHEKRRAKPSALRARAKPSIKGRSGRPIDDKFAAKQAKDFAKATIIVDDSDLTSDI